MTVLYFTQNPLENNDNLIFDLNLVDINYCFGQQEATRLALVSGDKPCYAGSIRIMGDIYRKKMEIGVSI